MPDAPLKIMVASTVHGFSENLEAVYATLTEFGYDVWCSYKGTIPAHPGKSNLDNCIEAAKNCDLFLGILRPYYGSGVIGATSITHEEIKTAVDENKPRWFLAHRDIDLIRQLLKKLYTENGDGSKNRDFKLDRGPILDDLRVLDTYNYALMSHIPVAERTGHWVQSYFNFSTEGMEYIRFQFRDIDGIRRIIEQMNQENE
jgi:hypothetical protein